MGKRKRATSTKPSAAVTSPAPPAVSSGFPYRPGFLSEASSNSISSETRKRKKSDPASPKPTTCTIDKPLEVSQDVASAPIDKSAHQGTPSVPPRGVTAGHETDPTTQNYYSRANPHRVIVCVSPNTTLYLSGACSLTVLRGGLNINGYKPKMHACIRGIFSPVWNPAHRIHFGEAKKEQRQGMLLKDTLKQQELLNEFPGAQEDTKECAILLEGADLKDMEWLLAAEDFSKYSLDNLSINGGAAKNYASVVSALICDLECMAALKINVLSVPKHWVSAATAVIAGCNIYPKAMLCGAKGVGKSTCLKYTINRLLSKLPAVCVIDCDLGQPEFTPPGVLSLHLIDEPILTVSHMNLRKPILSYFVGETTSKHDPSIFLRSIEKLLDQYHDMAQLQARKYKLSADSTSSSNIFGALEDEFTDKVLPLPLLLNTDGFIRYLGDEILSGITKRLRPNHIIQLVSEKDKKINAIENYLQENITEEVEGLPQLHTVEVGKASASRIGAVDLRTLRLVSYFLRYSKFIKGSYPKELGDNISNQSEGSGPTVYIKSGGLVDPQCTIAKALLLANVESIPMSTSSLTVLSGESIRYDLLPALFSASLVGVHTVGTRGSPQIFQDDDNEIKVISLKRRLPDSSVQHFDINLRESAELMPSEGLAIVRAVDTLHQVYHIIEPVSLNDTSLLENIPLEKDLFNMRSKIAACLSKGSMQIPTLMTYVSEFPLYQYFSSDSVGEGSTSMKGRSNLKRRGGMGTNDSSTT